MEDTDEGHPPPNGGTDCLMVSSSADIAIPLRLIDRVVGQERAVARIRLAAAQRRSLLLIGSPGTGKSLLGRAIAELLPKPPPRVLLCRARANDPVVPRILMLSLGEYAAQVAAAKDRGRATNRERVWLIALVALAAAIIAGWMTLKDPSAWPALATVVVLGLVVLAGRRTALPRGSAAQADKVLLKCEAEAPAPFIDATGCRDGALFGDVRHDPYQSGGREVPPHQLVELGAIHRAHGGVLYLDEIGGLSIEAQRLLLTALQDKQLPISGRTPGSSGTLIRTEPVPCDFVLVAAGNDGDLEQLMPALRSRIMGYGYEVLLSDVLADTPEAETGLRRLIAQEVASDGRIPHFDAGAMDAVVAEARRRGDGVPTARLRELGGLIRAAGDLAVSAGAAVVTAAHVVAARPLVQTIEEQRQAELVSGPGRGRSPVALRRGAEGFP